MLYEVTCGYGRIVCLLVCVLVLVSCAHRGVSHSHAIISGYILQMSQTCVFTIALRAIRVFKHCATYIGAAFISTSCIRGQVSESSRARSVTKCESSNTSSARDYSQSYIILQHSIILFINAQQYFFMFTTVTYIQRLHPALAP